MDEDQWLAARFEEHQGELRAVAYRMLGSLAEADDAVQEAWLRFSRSDVSGVDNLGAWLTTVVGRVCLNMLRSRTTRREDPLTLHLPDPVVTRAEDTDPEHQALLADSVGLALLVVLDMLSPAERLAFVLHDMFAVPFDQIAPIVGRSPAAARQLASRARRRVQGAPSADVSELSSQREIVEAFLAALRAGDFDGLVAILDPDIVVGADAAAATPGLPRELRGAHAWARGAVAAARGARFARPALVNGVVGVVVAPRGRLFRVLSLTIRNNKITRIDVIGDPERLRGLDLAVLDDPEMGQQPMRSQSEEEKQ